jgi:hypothetical protein
MAVSARCFICSLCLDPFDDEKLSGAVVSTA